jgi:hypothetical protein
MKMTLILLFVPLASFANSVETVFNASSALPAELQVRVLEAVKARCSRGLTFNTLRETSTRVRKERVDQGIVDYFYTTDLETTYYFDGMHPVGATITVESAEFDISNPAFDRFRIVGVRDGNAGICQ